MIIQCEQCRTKFKLDDAKVSERGVKVRCAKCRHVFTVRKSTEDTLNLPDGALSAAADTTIQTVAPATFDIAPPPLAQESAETVSDTDVSFDFGAPAEPAAQPAAAETAFDFGDIAFSTEAPAAPAAAFDFGEKTMVMAPKAPAAPEPDFGSFDFGDAQAQAAPAADSITFDFGGTTAPPATAPVEDSISFDFGDAAPATTSQQAAGDFDFGTATPPATGEVDFGGFDFGDAATAPAQGTDDKKIDDGFNFDLAAAQPATADSFDLSGVDFGSVNPSTESAAKPADAFTMGELDFTGDTTAVAVAAPVEAAHTGTLFSPVEDTATRHKTDSTFEAPSEVSASEEQPPLSISSRRRQGTSPAVIALAAVLVLALLGYIAYMFTSGNSPATVDSKAGATEEGKITVRNIKAYFIPKAAAGELLVITGEAVNNHKKPRASLQIKGVVFGAQNQAIATRTAYAGNQLTKEQLLGMSADKIEAAMNNQFGDSLSNMGVEPGKGIAFTIVIVNPPKDGKEFGVEPAGSTVAAAK